jgi:hypothetical protein
VPVADGSDQGRLSLLARRIRIEPSSQQGRDRLPVVKADGSEESLVDIRASRPDCKTLNDDNSLQDESKCSL